MTRVGFAGAGHIAIVHGLAVSAIPGASVVKVASRTPGRADELARRVGAEVCGYDQVATGVDVVVVSTPPARHVSDALAALAAGAAVVVEKPLATTLADADQLLAADTAAGHRVGYAENLAFSPLVLRAVSMSASMGPLRHADARMLQGRPDWGEFLTEGWGGGVLFDLGAHPLALVLLLADAGPGGEDAVTSVRAHVEAEPDVPVDTWADVTLDFASGLSARVEVSWRSPTAVVDLQAAADEGVVRAELRPQVAVERNGEPLMLPAVQGGVDPRLVQFGYLPQLEHFFEDFATGAMPAIGVAFGALVLELTCAAYASAANDGDPVAMPFEGPRDRTPLQIWHGA
jgi:predicted dehydrogenase